MHVGGGGVARFARVKRLLTLQIRSTFAGRSQHYALVGREAKNCKIAYLPHAHFGKSPQDRHLQGSVCDATCSSQAAQRVLFDPSDAVVLLLDHQTGLFQTVNDVPVSELRANTVALAKIAEQAAMPIIYAASEPDGQSEQAPSLWDEEARPNHCERSSTISLLVEECSVFQVRDPAHDSIFVSSRLSEFSKT